MSLFKFNITISLDGYVAGPNQSITDPLGEGGEKLHEWAFAVRTFRERPLMEFLAALTKWIRDALVGPAT